MGVHVNVDNFVEAETARMFRDLQAKSGAPNTFSHVREPSPIDEQLVVRLNRDTLYSFAVVDTDNGVHLTIPEHGDRYVSAMVVSEGHFVPMVFHEAGRHSITRADVGSRHAVIAMRILVDAQDPADVEQVQHLQDACTIDAGPSVSFEMAEYDTASFDATRVALLELARGLTGFDGMFGLPGDVNPVRHLIGTAAGWGGLPQAEASYIGVEPKSGGRTQLTLKDVPVDGFWSVSVYDAQGFFVANSRDSYSLNSVGAVADEDGSVTIRFGDFDDHVPNVIPTPDGWNFLVRLYRPRAEILDGTWRLPELVPVP